MLDQDVTDNFPTIKAPLKGWPTMPPMERGKIERPPRKGPPLRAIATIGEFHSMTSSAVASSRAGTERPSAGSLEVDHEIEPLRPLDRQVTRLGAVQNTAD